MKVIDVVGAVIIDGNQVFCAQRGPGGNLALHWEFPGGKVEVDESPRQALEREISEELACEIEVGEQITTTRHEYDFAVINLTTFYCRLIDGTPRLTEHADGKWLDRSQLDSLNWAPADIPAVEIIMRGSLDVG